MEEYVEVFQKRWILVVNETLSSVRRQLYNINFDISIVNRDFQASCAEWFEGKLAPHVWFQKLAEEHSDVALKFEQYVTTIRIEELKVCKPSLWKDYVLTALALPICYIFLGWVTGMGLVSKLVFSIGFSVLVWYTCQSLTKSKQSAYEESVVDFYRHQLDEHFSEIKKILL